MRKQFWHTEINASCYFAVIECEINNDSSYQAHIWSEHFEDFTDVDFGGASGEAAVAEDGAARQTLGVFFDCYIGLVPLALNSLEIHVLFPFLVGRCG